MPLMRTGQLNTHSGFRSGQNVLNRLETFAAYMDFSRTFTYTSGIDPFRPDNEPLSEEAFEALQGESLDQLLLS